VDDFLDGGGTGHRGLLAHERGHGTKRVTRDMPNGRQRRWTPAASGNHLVERVEMSLFLRGHLADRLGGLARLLIVTQHSELTGVDAHRAVLTGVVDTDHCSGAGSFLPRSYGR